jgi:hypothetical protein
MGSILERRTLPELPELATRADSDDPDVIRITGYGSVFNKPYKVWGVAESIAPGAFAKTLTENPDIRGMFNHDPSYLLGRTKSGTMDVTEDDKGLRYEIRASAKNPQSVAVADMIRRKDVDGSSMAFYVIKDEWERDKDGRPMKRTIKEIELIETGPVTMPASPATSAKVKRAAASEYRQDITSFLLVIRDAGFQLTKAEVMLLASDEPEPAESHSDQDEAETSTLVARAAWERRRRMALCHT